MSDAPTTVDFPEVLPAQRRSHREWRVETDGVEVTLTNLDKPYWPRGQGGFTKADVVAHYWNVAPAILPYLRDRPLTLKRMPDGAAGDFFYAKQAPPNAPSWMRRAPVVSLEDGRDGKRIDYLLADDRAGLVWLANAGCIELHPWHSRADALGRPDYAFFDLDPMGRADFAMVRDVALLVRTVLQGLGLRGYPRLSGATGMQVYVPVDRVHSYAEVRGFVGRACELIHAADPRHTTMTWEIDRRGDTIFLDHGMNTEGKNIAATWCLRPEPFAPAAAPVSWQEVEEGIAPTDVTIASVWPRLRGEDGFAAVLQGGQDFVAALEALDVPRSPVVAQHRLAEPLAAPHAAKRPGPDLAAYRGRRDFARTAEPSPDVAAEISDEGPRFVLQHHLATRLHHDLRLERDGVGVSWALPKGLPARPGTPHLAVHTEDHPLSYFTFTGTIPAGEYGGGEVRRWDAGTYHATEWTDGKVSVALEGGRHRGEWHLFRTGEQRPDHSGEQWLVVRVGEPEALPPPPPTVAPMLATSVAAPFDDDDFVFEVKWDGVRAVATLRRPDGADDGDRDGSTRLVSRAGNDVTGGYPELAGLWERLLARNAVVDGEIVALHTDGRPSFELLQQRMHVRGEQAARAARSHPVTYVAFDLLALDGAPLVDLPLRDRLTTLEQVLVAGGPLVRSEPVRGQRHRPVRRGCRGRAGGGGREAPGQPLPPRAALGRLAQDQGAPRHRRRDRRLGPR